MITILFGTWLLAQAIGAGPCLHNTSDPQIAFLDHIARLYGNGAIAISAVNGACAEIDLMAQNSGAFGEYESFNLSNSAIGALQSLGLGAARAALMSQEAESAGKVAEMRRVNPGFMARLDRIKAQSDPWKRMQLAYNIVGAAKYNYEQNMATAIVTDPVAAMQRIQMGKPIGICVHFAALLDFALTYVGPGAGVSNFDVKINAGNVHAWNNVSFKNSQGRPVTFDLDATHFRIFTPLSVSHWDRTLPGTGDSEKIIKACLSTLACMRQN
jgi:hypothetical protein